MCSIESLIRLVLQSRCSGRVEVYHNSTWKTLCDEHWGMPNARVACRQVGCGSPINTSYWNHTGHKTGQIWLRVDCLGQEGSLEDCLQRRPGLDNCSRTREAAVTCSGEWGDTHGVGNWGISVHFKGSQDRFCWALYLFINCFITETI